MMFVAKVTVAIVVSNFFPPVRSPAPGTDNWKLSMTRATTCLGLHIGHDRAITIAQDGHVTFHTAVERLDRRKHSDSSDLPIAQIRQVLDRLGIAVHTIAGVCVTYHAVDAARIARTLAADFKEAFPEFEGVFSTLDHHLAHGIAALACSPFDEALFS